MPAERERVFWPAFGMALVCLCGVAGAFGVLVLWALEKGWLQQ